MNLINRYVNEVSKHLAFQRGREDIEKELRSTLEDMLEDRAQKAGKPADEAMQIELLKEYGDPRKVAESYFGPRYLVGPRIYPLFELVTKIALSVIIGIAIVGLGIRLAAAEWTGINFLMQITNSGLSLLENLIIIFGNIVIVFAILDRTLPDEEFEETEEWTPANLKAEPEHEQVKIGEQIVSILFLVLFLVIFNLYPEIDRYGLIAENDWVFLPIVLSDAFFNYLPWINLLFLIEIGSALYLIRKGVWSLANRVVTIVINLFGVILAVTMLRGPALVNAQPKLLEGTNLAEHANTLAGIGSLIPAIVLIIVIIISGIEIAQMTFKIFNVDYKTK